MRKDLCFEVIMPCYNSEKYVRDAITSILNQTYSNWRLIAVNDGSTDRTPEFLSDYSKKDSRIKVLSKENGGYVSAVNYGLDNLTGDYFLMMGSDDRLFPDLFERITDELEDDLPDLIAFRTVQFIKGVSQGVELTTFFNSKEYAYNTTIKQFSSQFPSHADIFFQRDTSKCFKKTLLGDLRLFGKYGFDADGIFSTLFAHKATSFMSIPVDGYHWTLRSDSLSAKTNLPINLDRLNNWKLFFEYNTELYCNDITQQEKKYAKSFLQIARETAFMIDKNDHESMKRFKNSTKCIPAIYKKLKIRLGKKEKLEVFLLVHFPGIWVEYKRRRCADKK